MSASDTTWTAPAGWTPGDANQIFDRVDATLAGILQQLMGLGLTELQAQRLIAEYGGNAMTVALQTKALTRTLPPGRDALVEAAGPQLAADVVPPMGASPKMEMSPAAVQQPSIWDTMPPAAPTPPAAAAAAAAAAPAIPKVETQTFQAGNAEQAMVDQVNAEYAEVAERAATAASDDVVIGQYTGNRALAGMDVDPSAAFDAMGGWAGVLGIAAEAVNVAATYYETMPRRHERRMEAELAALESGSTRKIDESQARMDRSAAYAAFNRQAAETRRQQAAQQVQTQDGTSAGSMMNMLQAEQMSNTLGALAAESGLTAQKTERARERMKRADDLSQGLDTLEAKRREARSGAVSDAITNVTGIASGFGPAEETPQDLSTTANLHDPGYLDYLAQSDPGFKAWLEEQKQQ